MTMAVTWGVYSAILVGDSRQNRECVPQSCCVRGDSGQILIDLASLCTLKAIS